MIEELKLTKYDKDNAYSYAFGIFPTFELVKNCSDKVIKVILSTKLKMSPDVNKLLEYLKNTIQNLFQIKIISCL